MTGAGLQKILLLSKDSFAQQHFMLDRLIRRSGLDKNAFYFDTANDPGWWQRAQDAGVKVVVALGEHALRSSTRQSEIRRWRGRVVDTEFPWLTIPTFSPGYLLPRKGTGEFDPEIMRNPSRYQGRVIRDLLYAQHVATKGFTRRSVRYSLDPSPEQFLVWAEEFLRELRENPDLLLSFDIETPYKKDNENEDDLEEKQKQSERNLSIIRISFAYKEAEAVTIPWTGQYLPAIKMLLESSAPKVTWNGRDFDIPVLRHNDVQVRGRHFDGFDLMKFWQSDLDRGLEVTTADTTDLLPWKHLSDAMPEWYSAVDADAALRSANHIISEIKRQGAWDVFLETFVDLMPHMTAAGERGNALDHAYQQELKVEFRAESERLDQEIQEVVPDEFRVRERKKRKPADLHRAKLGEAYFYFNAEGNQVEPVMVKGRAKFCTNCGLQVSNKSLHLKGGKKKNPCAAAEATLVERDAMVEEWDVLLPFNVGSSQQLIAYAKAHKHPVAKNADNPDNDAMPAEHLETLAQKYGAKHPVYALAGQKKRVDKAESTYLWIPGSDGRVHQTYVNSPNTLRFGGRAYNLMNVGKRERNPHAVKARNQIIASPGHVLVQADSTSVEGVMQGWYMGDVHFMWLANQSSHAWLASQYLGWEFNPDTVERIKKEKKALYDGMKVMNYTISFGGSAYGAWKANPKVFPTLKHAEEIEAIIFRLLPTLEAYQYEQRYRAHKQGYIESPWKWRGYFYDVYTYKRHPRTGEIEYTLTGRPKLKLSKDGKRVVAVLPQHSNAMFARQNLKRIGDSKWGRYMPANVFVHDGYTLDVPIPLAEEAEDFLLTLLTRSIPEMGGLRVGAASDIGKNWGDYHAVHNPNGMKGSRKIVIDKQELSWMPTSAAVPEEMLKAA